MTVEDALKELREMFPDGSFLSVKQHAIISSLGERVESDIQIDGKGFRSYYGLPDCMTKVRQWKQSQE